MKSIKSVEGVRIASIFVASGLPAINRGIIKKKEKGRVENE